MDFNKRILILGMHGTNIKKSYGTSLPLLSCNGKWMSLYIQILGFVNASPVRYKEGVQNEEK